MINRLKGRTGLHPPDSVIEAPIWFVLELDPPVQTADGR